MKYTASDIADYLGQPLSVADDRETVPTIDGPACQSTSSSNHLIFLKSSDENIARFSDVRAGLVITESRRKKAILEKWNRSAVAAIIWSSNARLDFCRAVEHFFVPPAQVGIHSSAIIHPTAQIGQEVWIGPGCNVGEDVIIGNNCQLYSNVSIYPKTHIGNGAVIHAGVAIGVDGFGFERAENGKWQKFPHFGAVMIGENVEIGANTTIDRGSLGNTIIGDGVKIDNLVHIAHNAEIGKNCLIIAGAVVCGGAKIGANCWISPQSCVSNQKSIGERTTVGMGAFVLENIEKNSVVVGFPAHRASAARRIAKLFAKVIN